MHGTELVNRIKEYRAQQFRDSSTGSFPFRLFRYWFGWGESTEISQLNNYALYLKQQGNLEISAESIEEAFERNSKFSSILKLFNHLSSTRGTEKTPLLAEAPVTPRSVERSLLAAAAPAPGEIVDLTKLPKARTGVETNAQTTLTIGDLHGNALKLIYFLVREGVLSNISERDYRKLADVYRTHPNGLTGPDIDDFNRILNSATVTKVGLIRLIGDVLADRGMLDYWTLQVLMRLKTAGVPVENEISNHDVEFIKSYSPSEVRSGELVSGQARSLDNLIPFLNRFPGRKAELDTAVEYYKSTLKLLSYSLSSDGTKITLYSHAPIGLSTIIGLAEVLEVEFKNETAKALGETIDRINQAANTRGIAEIYRHFMSDEKAVRLNFFAPFTEIFNIAQKLGVTLGLRYRETVVAAVSRIQKDFEAKLGTTKAAPVTNEEIEDFREYLESMRTFYFHPLYQLIWNRDHAGQDRPAKSGSINYSFVHGHDTPDDYEAPGHVHNLDNSLGKGDDNFTGEYHVLRSSLPVAPAATAAAALTIPLEREAGGLLDEDALTAARSKIAPHTPVSGDGSLDPIDLSKSSGGGYPPSPPGTPAEDIAVGYKDRP